MKSSTLFLGTALYVFTLACHGEGTDESWPCWRGSKHDGCVSMGMHPPAAWPKALSVVWQMKVGIGFSSPICDGSSVFLQTRSETEELVSAYELSGGKLIWQIKLAVIADAQTHEPSPTPSASKGALYVHSMTGAVFKLDARDGKTLWKRDLPAEWTGGKLRASYGVAASPILDDKNLLLPIGDKATGRVLALKQSDGTTAWELPSAAPGYSSLMPVKMGGTVCLATLLFNELAMYKQDGEKYVPAFRFEFSGGGDGNASMPVPIGENRLLITNHEATVALDVAPGATKCTQAWRLEVGGNLSTPVFVRGRIYVCTERALLCLDPANGKTLSSLDVDAQYCALLSWGNLLVCRLHDGALKFVDIQNEAMKIAAEYPEPKDNGESWSAPIPVSPTRMVWRTGESLQCLTWEK